MNLERGFRRITWIVSVVVLGLACRLVAWPAAADVLYGLSWVSGTSQFDDPNSERTKMRPERFVVQTEAGPYLVGSTRPMGDDQLQALFSSRNGRLDPDQDERVDHLVVDLTASAREFMGLSWEPPPQGHLIVGSRHSVRWGITSFLLPYLVAPVGMALVPWVLFYLVRWIVRGFVRP